jgi:transposase-like protein
MAKDQQKTQKGQGIPDFTEDQARNHFEKLRWPNGPACVHCGSEKVTRIEGKSVRPGVIQCNDCREQFTVTVGTVMEDSHLPLAKWVKAFHFMASSKKGMSALQLQRNLGLGSYRTAWHLAHRIRYAMRTEVSAKLSGTVEIDETYIGGKPRGKHNQPKGSNIGRGTKKTPVIVLVQRDGNARSKPVERCDALTLKWAIRTGVEKTSTIMTDDWTAYRGLGKEFDGGHHVVNHTAGEYSRGFAYTNTAESFFSLIKRGVYGNFHHVSRQHMFRYCDEFSFRWNGRKMMDSERRDLAITQIEGKRLFLFQSVGEA